ncbi:sigma-70 family RNA polymerase sigma factor [bacterium]|nr:sigma-70 family RNA polymerase sigma factor [bacterium]
MSKLPDTSASLVLRLKNHADADAWREFSHIYQPVVYRMIRKRGFQPADASEISQEMLMSVASAIKHWDPDKRKGSFRGWLFKIARNEMVDFLKHKRRKSAASGGTDLMRLIEQSPDPRSPESNDFDLECRRQIYQHAAMSVRNHFSPNTWQAFERTTIDGEAIPEVAASLNMSVAAVYVARSRVMKQLQLHVKRSVNRESGFLSASQQVQS